MEVKAYITPFVRNSQDYNDYGYILLNIKLKFFESLSLEAQECLKRGMEIYLENFGHLFINAILLGFILEEVEPLTVVTEGLELIREKLSELIRKKLSELESSIGEEVE
mgnify:CR=1 FL=1